MPKKDKITGMFNNIAPEYDSLNHLLSLDVDKSWRKKAIKQIVDTDSPLNVADIACGTGDFSIAIAKAIKSGSITGIDLSEGMLEVLKEKVEKAGLRNIISEEIGDGENLRFEDNTFDRVTIAFGIRNFENKEKGLREMLRVLKTGGKVVILELSLPENPIMRWAFNLYFMHILPFIGGKVSGNKAAYKYLPASVVSFPNKNTFVGMMKDAGFSNVTHKAFTFGICRMFIGEKN